MSEYEKALVRAKAQGVGKTDDAAAMAAFCASTIQTLLGAVSPKLIWDGAQASGLTLLDLGRLCSEEPTKAADLMLV